MAFSPTTLTITSWASPVTITENDSIKNLDNAVNDIIDTNANSVKAHINTELGKIPAYLTDNLTALTNEFNTVVGNITAVETVATDIANVNTTAGSIANVNTVGANIANVNILAPVSANITTVAGSIANVNIVANDIVRMNVVADNIAAVQNASLISGSLASLATTDKTDLVSAVNEVKGIAEIASFKNKLINGGFDVWQRGVSVIVSSVPTYTSDRWLISVNTATANCYQAFGEATKYNLAIAQQTSPSTYAFIEQRIESTHSIALKNKSATISFRAYSDKGVSKSFAVRVSYPTVTDNYTAQTEIYIDSTLVHTGTSVYEDFIVTIPNMGVNVDKGLSMQIILVDGLAVSEVFALGKVQLEEGSIATPFENRPIGVELALCQRTLFVPSQLGNYGAYGVGRWVSTIDARLLVNMPVPMHSIPAVVVNGGVSQYAVDTTGVSVTPTTSISVNSGLVSTSLIELQIVSSGGTTNTPVILRNNNQVANKLWFDAELY